MRSKILVSGMILALVGSVIAFGCAPAPAPAVEAELKPCEVSVPLIENIFLGKECISLAPTFAIYNPNDYEVNIEKLEYEAVVQDWWVGGRDVALNVFIPAKAEIKVSGAFVLGFVDLAMWLWNEKGVSMGAAMAAAIPLWKSLDGALMVPALQEVWDKAPVERPTFEFEGRIHIVSPEGQELVTDFSTTWQMPAEVQMWK